VQVSPVPSRHALTLGFVRDYESDVWKVKGDRAWIVSNR
jgi:hypothetical protein